jgi:hypothetical protein
MDSQGYVLIDFENVQPKLGFLEDSAVIARAIAKTRVRAVKKPKRKIRANPRKRIVFKKRVPSKRTPHRRLKRKTHGQRQ